MNWLKTSDVCKMLKAEIKAQTGKVVNVRKSHYDTIEVDVSRYPRIKSRVEEIVALWRAGSMGMFDNFERNSMWQLENPETGCQVVWCGGAVENHNVFHLAFQVNVAYDYIVIVGGNLW